MQNDKLKLDLKTNFQSKILIWLQEISILCKNKYCN